MYYILMVLFDIGFYIAENWRGLTMTALFSAIGMAVGKRIGAKYTIDYIMKRFGLEKKSKLEQQIEHHESEIIKMGGTPWVENGDTRKSWMAQTTFLKKRSLLSLVAIHRKGKWRMNKFKSRKFILAVVGALLIILNDGLELGIDSDTVLAFAGLLATWIVSEGARDTARALKGEPKNAELNIPIEPRI